MKALYTSYKKFDSFIKTQLLVIFINSLGWALMLPIITKLQGLLWTTSIISSYLILHKISAFLIPLFKDIALKELYKRLIILDCLYLFSIPIYFYSPLVFLYTEATLMIIYGIILSVFGINYDAYLMDTYQTNIFKDMQYIERMSMAIAGIAGYCIVILVDILSSDLDISLIVFICLLSISILFQLYNYKYYWIKVED